MLVRIEESTWRGLVAHLLAREDVESAAVLYAEAIETNGRAVLVVRDWAPVSDDAYQVRRIDQIRIDPVALNRLVRPARDRGRGVFTIHSHPMAQQAWFSDADDRGDARLLPSFASQIPGMPHGSMVIARTGATVARALSSGDLQEVQIHAVGRTLQIVTDPPAGGPTGGRFARQALALGDSGQRALGALRVAIVGLGGVGSVVAAQLGHLGIGSLLLIDGDLVEESNASRLVGVEPGDVDVTTKTAVARRYLERIGSPSRIECSSTFLERPDQLARLAGCDVILSCVDRHTPRALLNRLAYRALVPVIDMGSGFRVDGGGAVVGAPGRVVVAGPGRPCLACWGHIDPEKLRLEALPPLEREALRRDGYISGAEVPQPSVMPFNVMIAGAAVIELLRLVTGFAGAEEPPNRLAFQFTDGSVRRNKLAADADCGICGQGREVRRPGGAR